MDWTALTSDPLDKIITEDLSSYLRSISHFKASPLLEIFSLKSRDKVVLHIGCFEHDANYVNSTNWKHRQIDAASKSCVGIDINKDGIELVKSMGFEALCMDATGTGDIGKKFDTIIVGDVIEHLTNIDGLMCFCKRHLAPFGEILISTPNPFYVGHVLRAWTSSPAPANLEHVNWISEFNMNEICRRSVLQIKGIYYPAGNSTSSKIIRIVKQISFKFRCSALFTGIVYVVGEF